MADTSFPLVQPNMPNPDPNPANKSSGLSKHSRLVHIRVDTNLNPDYMHLSQKKSVLSIACTVMKSNVMYHSDFEQHVKYAYIGVPTRDRY